MRVQVHPAGDDACDDACSLYRMTSPAPPLDDRLDALDDRLDALEATNAELLDALAKATTLAQVRAAAQVAAG